MSLKKKEPQKSYDSLYSSTDEDSPTPAKTQPTNPKLFAGRARVLDNFNDATIKIPKTPTKPFSMESLGMASSTSGSDQSSAVVITPRGSSRNQIAAGGGSSRSKPLRPKPKDDPSFADTVLIKLDDSAKPTSTPQTGNRIPEDSQSTAYEPSNFARKRSEDAHSIASSAFERNRPRKTSAAGVSTGESSSSTAVEAGDPFQLLPSALSDSKSYKILRADKLEEWKQEFSVLSQQVSALQNRLTLESKIREAAITLGKAEGGRLAQDQLEAANKKVEAIASDLRNSTSKMMEAERVILRHTAAVLRFGTRNSSSNSKSRESDSSDLKAATAKLASVETKVKEYEREIVFLKSTVTRLETEASPMKKELDTFKKKLDLEAQDKRKLERTIRDNERQIKNLEDDVTYLKSGPTSASFDVNRLKLDLATLRADNGSLQEDLNTTKKQLSDVQNRLDQEVNGMEEKDRIITNLLSELEEVANQLEVTASINEAYAVANSKISENSSEERRLRKQVEVLESKLKEFANRKSTAIPNIPLPADRKSGFSRTNSISIRERNSIQTEAARSVMRQQLQEAVEEKDRIQEQLSAERAKVRKLEDNLDNLQQTLAKQSTSIPESQLAGLKSLWTKLPSVSTLKSTERSSSSVKESRDDSDSFTLEDFERKVSLLDTQRRDLIRNLETSQRDLQDVKEDFLKSSKKFKALESSERDLRDDLKDLERKNEALENDLAASKQEFSLMNATTGSSMKQVEDLQAQHTEELVKLRERYEKKLKDVQVKFKDELKERLREAEAAMKGSFERKMKELEMVLKAERESADESASRLSDAEAAFQKEKAKLESRHQQEVDELVVSTKREVSEALERERARNDRIRNELEAEVQELQQNLDDFNVKMESEVRKSVRKVEEALEDEYQEKLESAERSFKDQILELQRTHADEKDQLERSLKDDATRSARQEIEAQTRALEEELTSFHSNEIESLRSKHKQELQKLQDDYRDEINDMKSSLSRAESSLLSSKSQFFSERERLQEEIDDLEEQLRAMKQVDAKKATEFANKTRELEEIAEDIRSEMAQVERDYLNVSGKLDSQKLQYERELNEEKEKSANLRKQLENIQRKLEQAQDEVSDARNATNPKDKETVKQLVSDVDRLQQTVIDLKRAKNELLEELDDQGIRVLSIQTEMNRYKKENERMARNLGDWEAERKRFESTTQRQREDIDNLQSRIQEFSVLNLGGKSSEPPTTQALRTEFRKLVSDLRQEYQAQINREVEVRAELETKLRSLNKDRDADMFNKTDFGTQTNVRWVNGDQPQTRSFGF
ncbi:UNVERIFIED_CONTAM: hypothetical protein HDU68_006207 [Siphonaria sp. JEL0065]|nr:hypothetical protein HDU68_006207 [Siphonaria sp. JEL0065]